MLYARPMENGPAPARGPDADADGPPAFQIVAGRPTAEEVAAVAVALAAKFAAGARPLPPPARRANWSDHSRLLRPPPQPGPGAWRRSALPR